MNKKIIFLLSFLLLLPHTSECRRGKKLKRDFGVKEKKMQHLHDVQKTGSVLRQEQKDVASAQRNALIGAPHFLQGTEETIPQLMLDPHTVPEVKIVTAENQVLVPARGDQENISKNTQDSSDESIMPDYEEEGEDDAKLVEPHEEDSDIVESVEPDEKADIYLNFENSDFESFVSYIANLHKINVAPDSKIAGVKISLSMRTPLTPSGAWDVFLTLSDMAGFSVIKHGNLYKIIPSKERIRQPLPCYINVSYKDLPDTDETIRSITFLNNITSQEAKDLISGMLGGESSIIEQSTLNSIIVTAKSRDIRSAMEALSFLDQPGLQESVVVIQLTEANAVDVKDLFTSLMEKPEGNPLARLLGKKETESAEYFPGVKMVALERTNKLVLLGNLSSIQKIESFIKNHVDTSLKDVETPLHIYELQYADANQVANILKTVTSSEELDSEIGRKTAQYGGVRGGVKYFKNMKFQVEPEGNRLIVSCTDKEDWKLLKKTIQDLDKANPQVAVETLIVSVDFGDTKQLGAQLRNKRRGTLGNHLDVQTANLSSVIASPNNMNPVSILGNLLGALTPEIGSTFLTFGQENTNGVWGLLKILKEQVNTTVIQQPFLTVANKAKGFISAGETRRIVAARAISESGEVTQNSASSFKDKEANTSITFTPQINLNGIIKFDIEANVIEFISDEGDTLQRKVLTSATVADGQVLVLGGFVKTNVSESISKTPILGDIPLVGWFFKNKRRRIVKEYIFVFMCPTILRPRTKPGIELYTKMKLHQATDDVESTIQTKNVLDPIHNWFFNPESEDYSHKVVDFANARYQPTTVDIAHDPYYRTKPKRQPRTTHGKQKARHAEVRPVQTTEKGRTITEHAHLLDQEIEEKRKALKELLSSKNISSQPHTAEEKNPLKLFLSPKPSLDAAQKETT